MPMGLVVPEVVALVVQMLVRQTLGAEEAVV
jgi:hypothetical protein